QVAGKKTFPDFHTVWHFDDKVGQKYLLEAVGAPLVPSYVFYDKHEAFQWIEDIQFPKVFKLRRGAGSSHVRLVEAKSKAKKLVQKAFSGGFSQYNKVRNLKERWYKYKHGKSNLSNLAKGVLRFGRTTDFAKTIGNEKGYVYFQDFIPGNDFDIRVIVIAGKAFAIKRLVREGDFRASGSGKGLYAKHHFDPELISLSFDVARKIKSQSLSIDYVYKGEKSLIVEISYGFRFENFIEDCTGYWDQELNWYEGAFDAQGWMVESLLGEIEPDVTK